MSVPPESRDRDEPFPPARTAPSPQALRDFSRQRELQADFQPVKLNGLALEVVGLTRARWCDMARQRGIVIDMRTDLAMDLPAIMGVAAELRDAMVNLIFNAIDALPKGGMVRMRTSVLSDAANGDGERRDYVCLEVIDNGAGMDDETRRRCLEPFFTTKGERSTGLGLAMVYGTMQRHGSDITIESAPGEGTTVRFSFPLAAGSATADAASAAYAVPKLKILLIDDDNLVSAAVRDRLESDGHEVATADGGQAGIDAFLSARSHGAPFGVVISDLGMPHVDGREVCSKVKEADPQAIFILLTGWGQRMIAEGNAPVGADCVLSKPPTSRDLRRALAQCLEKKCA